MSSPNDSNSGQAAPGFSLSLNDIYFIIFRHKWKIIICALIGLVAGAAFKKLSKDTFISEAKLFIRYVKEDQSPTDINARSTVRTPGGRGSTVINSEIQILTSFDLAKAVAKSLTPERVLGPSTEEIKPSEEARLIAASNHINRRLEVGSGRDSSIISIAFKDLDETLVHPVLSEVVAQYLERHIQIHRTSGKFDDYLTQTTDQLKSKLAATETELERIKKQAGIISLEGSKETLSTQLAAIQQALFEAQTLLAEKSAIARNDQNKNLENSTASTSESSLPEPISSPVSVAQEYTDLIAQIGILRTRENTLLAQFTRENSLVKSIRTQIQQVEERKSKLEIEEPSLLQNQIASTLPNTPGLPAQTFNLQSELIQIDALKSRVQFLQEQKNGVQAEAFALNEVEGSIRELERRRTLQEENYRNFATRLEQTRIDAILGTNDVSGISTIQEPTPPFRTMSKENQISAGIGIGGLILGLAWAALIELVLDQKIRRPIQVEKDIGIPLFLSIPNAHQRSFRKIANAKNHKNLKQLSASKAAKKNDAGKYAPKSPTLIAAAKSKPEEYGNDSLVIAPNSISGANNETQELKPYYEALRDRMIGYFESRNMTHSPKLIGLTGLGDSPGVTTTAAGLATCLSETGEGNVLLIDMTLGQESAQQFYNGTQVCGLEEALESKNSAKKSDKLFVVAEGSNGYKVPSILPNRLNNIVPKLKASDFDYIIFDMPEVSHISPTPRMAGFMDAMLLVVEADTTDKSSATKAAQLLKKSNPHVGAILNKTKRYLPQSLENDFAGNS